MKLLDKIENSDYKYTLAFLWFSKDDCQIELTYNWWESNYDHGTAYWHIALEVDDLYGMCELIRFKWAIISREPGPVLWWTAEIAFIKDPDNYSIELIQKWTL
jgi:lactoylglutathione lyase